MSLNKLYPSIPIISEEASESHDYAVRKQWDSFFLVDPLDGTKEFIGRNGEFTVNIALIQHGQPILGVVYAPALDLLYFAEKNQGAYKIQHDQVTQLLPHTRQKQDPLRVVISRSHACSKTTAFIDKLREQEKQIEIHVAGSALKFGLIAEGKADIYPRLAPTMEWDTAAGQIVVTEVGKKVILVDSGEVLHYNKVELRNPDFVVL